MVVHLDFRDFFGECDGNGLPAFSVDVDLGVLTTDGDCLWFRIRVRVRVR